MKYAIFLNGEYPEFIEEYKELLKDRVIYCADGGANFVYRERILPNVILGDLDSITSEALEYFKSNNVRVVKFSGDKDYTDFELVLMNIANLSYDVNTRFNDEIIQIKTDIDAIVFGATGYRVDMTLSNLKLLENNPNMIFITSSNEYVVYIDKKYEIKDKKGYIASPVPLTDIKSLTLKGFVYNLENKDIPSTSGLVSNIVADDLATIECIEGKILLFLRKEN